MGHLWKSCLLYPLLCLVHSCCDGPLKSGRSELGRNYFNPHVQFRKDKQTWLQDDHRIHRHVLYVDRYCLIVMRWCRLCCTFSDPWNTTRSDLKSHYMTPHTTMQEYQCLHNIIYSCCLIHAHDSCSIRQNHDSLLTTEKRQLSSVHASHRWHKSKHTCVWSGDNCTLLDDELSHKATVTVSVSSACQEVARLYKPGFMQTHDY